MAWYRTRQEEVDLDTFDPEGDYTGKELEAFATAMLRKDSRENKDEWQEKGILFDSQLANRYRREVYNKHGVPIAEDLSPAGMGDGQTMYNRTHPQGRKVNSDKQRREHGASFYR